MDYCLLQIELQETAGFCFRASQHFPGDVDNECAVSNSVVVFLFHDNRWDYVCERLHKVPSTFVQEQTGSLELTHMLSNMVAQAVQSLGAWSLPP